MTRKRRVFLVALLTLSLAGLAAPGEEPARTVDQAPSQFAALDRIRVHYKSLGHGETALVFVHGWTCDLTFWRSQVPAFAGHTRILLIDLPGHGQSDKPTIEYTMDLFARAVDAVLQDARVETAVLVGHSMGTPVIRQFYRLFPHKTRALVVVDGSLRAFDDKAGEFAQLIARLSGPDYQDNQAKFIDSMFTETTPAGVRETVKATMQNAPQHVAVSAMKGMFDPAIWTDDTIAVPLQVIVAKAPFWSADYEQYVRKLAPQVDYRVMDGVGHFLMLENPGAFNELLAAFVRKERLLKP
jgi:pimeloyl-ACP methyl ester carboxylesterase